jgi:hypothetical protein
MELDVEGVEERLAAPAWAHPLVEKVLLELLVGAMLR